MGDIAQAANGWETHGNGEGGAREMGEMGIQGRWAVREKSNTIRGMGETGQMEDGREGRWVEQEQGGEMGDMRVRGDRGISLLQG